MNAQDRADFERFARNVAAEELKTKATTPTPTVERVRTTTDADPLERT